MSGFSGVKKEFIEKNGFWFSNHFFLATSSRKIFHAPPKKTLLYILRQHKISVSKKNVKIFSISRLLSTKNSPSRKGQVVWVLVSNFTSPLSSFDNRIS